MRATIDTITITDAGIDFLKVCQNLSCSLICRFLLLYIEVYLNIDTFIIFQYMMLVVKI